MFMEPRTQIKICQKNMVWFSNWSIFDHQQEDEEEEEAEAPDHAAFWKAWRDADGATWY